MRLAIALAVLATANTAWGSFTTTTLSFQQGTNGYTGTYDRLIKMTGSADGASIDTNSTTMQIDGDPQDAARADYLIRFSDLIGSGAIPAQATILSATLDLTTTSALAGAASESDESYNVYRLTKSFSNSSTLDGDFGNGNSTFNNNIDGVEPEQDEADFILGTFEPEDGVYDRTYSASVTRAVQSWVNGDTNFGLAVVSDHIDQDDGWSVHSTGSSLISARPKPNVTYTTDANVLVTELQEGLNGYNGTTDIRLTSNTLATTQTLDGSTASELFIDGSDGGTSYDDPYLIKFADVGSLTGREVVSAELLLTTGFSSTSSDSPGSFTIHQLLQPFDLTSDYADLAGDVNAMLLAGQIGPAADTVLDIEESEFVSLDISSIVQNWLDGQPNFGFYIAANGTDNGWQIFSSGALDPDLAPMLRIITIPEPTTLGLLGMTSLLALRRRR